MNKKKIIFFFASLAMFVLIIISVMIVSIPDNPISFRYRLYFNKNLNALLPEGWAFLLEIVKKSKSSSISLTTKKD